MVLLISSGRFNANGNFNASFNDEIIKIVLSSTFREAVLRVSHGGIAGQTDVRKKYDCHASVF